MFQRFLSPMGTDIFSTYKRAALCAVMLTTAALVSGCSKQDIPTGSVPRGYEQRFPILITNAPIIVDLYLGAAGFDVPNIDRVRGFASLHREKNGGPVDINFPRNAALSPRTPSIVAAIENLLVANNIRVPVKVRFYDAADERTLAPIRLSFVALKAKVAGKCGEWPEDMVSGDSLKGWSNRNYHDYGCSYQNMIAAQTADPSDLMSPRADGNSDIIMRTRAIEKVRAGSDPSTGWAVKNSNIGGAGS